LSKPFPAIPVTPFIVLFRPVVAESVTVLTVPVVNPTPLFAAPATAPVPRPTTPGFFTAAGVVFWFVTGVAFVAVVFAGLAGVAFVAVEFVGLTGVAFVVVELEGLTGVFFTGVAALGAFLTTGALLAPVVVDVTGVFFTGVADA
jgi:hypothetical protein